MQTLRNGLIMAAFGISSLMAVLVAAGLPTASGQTSTDQESTARPETPPGVEYRKELLNRDVPSHEPPFPKTEEEIQRYRNDLIDEAFERVGHTKDGKDPIRVSSLAELKKYTDKDGVHVKMDPGTYTVTRENVGDLMTVNRALDYTTEKYGATLINFDGENTYFDLRGVTITYDTRILNGHWAEPFDYNPGRDIPHLFYVSGKNQVIRGLEVRGIEKDEWDEKTYNPRGTVTWGTYADRIMLWNVTMESRGSFPYGYSSMLGKGGPSLTNVSKHGLYRCHGIDNYHIGVKFVPRTFGHIINTSNSRSVYIDCTVEGETRTTNDVLKETSGPAYENDFVDVSRRNQNIEPETIQPGRMIALHEGTFRSYSSNLYLKVLSSKFIRSGKGLSPNSANGFYMANCKMRKNTSRGIYINSGGTVVDSSADVRYSPALTADGKTANSTVDLKIVPSSTPPAVTRHTLSNKFGEGVDQSAAQIAGEGHDVTLRTESVEALQSSLSDALRPMPILVGYFRHHNHPAKNITIRNETGLPIWLTETAKNCTIKTNGPVKDKGSGNTITRLENK